MAGKGVDVGTAFLVSAQKEENDNVTYQSVRNAFLEVAQEGFALKMLKKSGAPYVESEKNGKPVLYVLGEDSLHMASMFKQADFRRPLAEGVLSRGEVQAVEVLSHMLKELLGEPAEEGEPCYYSIPADARDSGQDARYHEAQIAKIIESVGSEKKYAPHALNEAHAVVFSSCADTNFSGLAFSFGAGMVNACLSYRSLPVFEFAIARGGDWVDKKSAESVGREVPQLTVIKEKDWSLLSPEKREHEALAVYYKELIKYLLDHLEGVLAEEGTTLVEPIPVIVSGGTSLVKGFDQVFEKALRGRDLPIEISEVKHAKNPMNAVALGLLMAAMYSD